MKNLKYILILAIAFSFINVSAQEKKIKFSKGTLKICSSKNFTIEGYDGDEVIIKSLHDKRSSNLARYHINGTESPVNLAYGNSVMVNGTNKNDSLKKGTVVVGTRNINTSLKGNIVFLNSDSNRKNGLKKLGKKNEDKELGIYFIIEQKGDELIFKDNNDGQLFMISSERYEIKIPNSLKLNWQTNGCKEREVETRKYAFFNSKASSLNNFNGEVEISTSLSNMKLKDVTGPVSINSIGGNVTIEFDKKTPKRLYSIYSNNGFIDITLPNNSDVTVDAKSSSIFSDIDFKVLEDKELDDMQSMLLKLKSGKVKMKLNAGLGNIYLRKK
jgi:hypothetical protein